MSAVVGILILQIEVEMDGSQSPFVTGWTPSSSTGRIHLDVNESRGSSVTSVKKRGHGSRSWIKIDREGNSYVMELDKSTIMRHCSLPARDLRLLDPLFIYPSTILGREKAIVVSLEQIRCIITADEVVLMNSLDRCVVQYNSELRKRLEIARDQPGDMLLLLLPLNFFLPCRLVD